MWGRFYEIIDDQRSGEYCQKWDEKRIFFKVFIKQRHDEKMNNIDGVGNVAQKPI
jgi:hypothetical protein